VIIARVQKHALLDRMESHLFLEEVTMQDVGLGEPQICLEGPRALHLLAHALDADSPESAAETLPVERHAFAPGIVDGHEVLIVRHSESGEDGFLLLAAPGEAQAVFGVLQEAGLDCNAVTVGVPAREVLRIEGGHAKYGPDIDDSCVINETPLEAEAVCYDKGCYLGQEVVARMKAYGSPKHALTGLRLTGDGVVLPKPGATLEIAGQRVGRLCSHAFSPTLGAHIALAYVGRNHRAPGDTHTFSCPETGDIFAATITPLPFVETPTRQELSRDSSRTRMMWMTRPSPCCARLFSSRRHSKTRMKCSASFSTGTTGWRKPSATCRPWRGSTRTA
jgi:folate-binding protein YgfZ